MKTYNEIAQELGMTRSGVRKIEQKALQKASAILEKHGYEISDLLGDIEDTNELDYATIQSIADME